MAEKDLNTTVTQASLQEAFVAELLKSESVIIPGLGYLEPQDLSGRHTVVFKAAAPADAVMKRLSVKSGKTGTVFAEAKEQISDVLRDNRAVNLPAIGIFKPSINDRGDLKVTFTLAQPLRKLLNGITPASPAVEIAAPVSEKIEGAIEIVEESIVIIEEPVFNKEESTSQGEPISKKGESVAKKGEIVEKPKAESFDSPVVSNSVGQHSTDKIVASKPVTEKTTVIETPAPAPIVAHKPQRQRRSKMASIDGRVALLAACVVVLIIVIAVLLPAEKEGHETKTPESKVTNLMDEAEKHYGNSAYWPYIYEANKNIINSPVNVPKTLKLTFPDLLEQGIDVKNPAEIRKAEVKSEIILRQLQ